jgi:hypothetical protein
VADWFPDVAAMLDTHGFVDVADDCRSRHDALSGRFQHLSVCDPMVNGRLVCVRCFGGGDEYCLSYAAVDCRCRVGDTLGRLNEHFAGDGARVGMAFDLAYDFMTGMVMAALPLGAGADGHLFVYGFIDCRHVAVMNLGRFDHFVSLDASIEGWRAGRLPIAGDRFQALLAHDHGGRFVNDPGCGGLEHDRAGEGALGVGPPYFLVAFGAAASGVAR